jgi:hypothetical protein
LSRLTRIHADSFATETQRKNFMEPLEENHEGLSPVVVTAVREHLQKLRYELALMRGVLRYSRRHHWGQDRYWQVKKYQSQQEYKQRIAAAARELSAFIRVHEWVLGDVPNNGRLCWHCFTGGLPIDTHYCELPEGHEGDHQNAIGKWTGKPKHPESKPAKPIITAIMAETRQNLRQFGTDYGKRSGPSIVMYRATNTYQHPLYRSFSCRGCIHLQVDEDEYRSAHCAHPEMIAKHEVPQSVATQCDKLLIQSQMCPAMRERVDLTQPYPAPIKGREAEYAAKPKH